MSSFDPREPLPRGCERCQSAPADIGTECALCAISTAADSDDFERCFAVAEDFGVGNVIVGRLIASSAAYRARAEGINAQRALLERMTGRAAVTAVAVSMTLDAPANDVVDSTGEVVS
jgi:hypothetical protein